MNYEQFMQMVGGKRTGSPDVGIPGTIPMPKAKEQPFNKKLWEYEHLARLNEGTPAGDYYRQLADILRLSSGPQRPVYPPDMEKMPYVMPGNKTDYMRQTKEQMMKNPPTGMQPKPMLPPWGTQKDVQATLPIMPKPPEPTPILHSQRTQLPMQTPISGSMSAPPMQQTTRTMGAPHATPQNISTRINAAEPMDYSLYGSIRNNTGESLGQGIPFGGPIWASTNWDRTSQKAPSPHVRQLGPNKPDYSSSQYAWDWQRMNSWQMPLEDFKAKYGSLVGSSPSNVPTYLEQQQLLAQHFASPQYQHISGTPLDLSGFRPDLNLVPPAGQESMFYRQLQDYMGQQEQRQRKWEEAYNAWLDRKAFHEYYRSTPFAELPPKLQDGRLLTYDQQWAEGQPMYRDNSGQMIYGNTIGNVPVSTPTNVQPVKPQGGVGYEGPYWANNPPPYNPGAGAGAAGTPGTANAQISDALRQSIERINAEYAAKGTFGSTAHLNAIALAKSQAGLAGAGQPYRNPYLYFGKGA